MIVLLRGLPAILLLGFLIYCLVDLIQTPAAEVRNLPKWAWLAIMIVIPDGGGIAWLIAGRPRYSDDESDQPWPAPHTPGIPRHQNVREPVLGPDDDPEFLAQMRTVDQEHERTLEMWEADLRRREEELRRSGRKDEPDGGDQR